MDNGRRLTHLRLQRSSQVSFCGTLGLQRPSYIVFLAENRRGAPSEVWIAGIRPDAPFYRQVSPPGVSLVRNDPEFFSTDTAAFIYYATRNDRSVYRANTGLGPPTSNNFNGTKRSEFFLALPQAIGFLGESDRIWSPVAAERITSFTRRMTRVEYYQGFQCKRWLDRHDPADGAVRIPRNRSDLRRLRCPDKVGKKFSHQHRSRRKGRQNRNETVHHHSRDSASFL